MIESFQLSAITIRLLGGCDQLPGHSPVARSNSRAPCRSITVLTTEKITPCSAAASRISRKEYSVSSAPGGSVCLWSPTDRAAYFHTCLKTAPATSPPATELARPTGRYSTRAATLGL